MQTENIELYTSYLYLCCEDILEKAAARVVDSARDVSTPATSDSVKREIAVLVRYWLSRDIWDAFDDDQELARELNLGVLRRFSEGFKLPKDGTGLKYAELPELQEQLRELVRRLSRLLGLQQYAALGHLEHKIADWRRSCREAVRNLQRLNEETLRQHVAVWLDARRDAGQEL